MHKRLLVTGFGPFPGVSENPSAAAARALHGQILRGRGGPWRVTGAELPTTWRGAWPALAAAVGAVAPHALILLGVSPRPRAEVERFAHNYAADRPDHLGQRPSGAGVDAPSPADLLPECAGALGPRARATLDPFGPPRLESTLPWADFAAGDDPSAPGLSLDAGDYLCNFLMYKALRHLPGIGRRGFVHLPPTPGPAAGVAAVTAVVARLG